MPSDPSQRPLRSSAGFSRRQFVKRAASGAIAAGAAFSSKVTQAGNGISTGSRKRPNIILIITDQERAPQYWPEGWGDTYLPNRKRLADHGLTFTRGFCNAAMCSPSRATLFTGLYLTQHGVEHTLTTDGTLSPNEPTLQPTTQNMAKLLASAGYNVQYRGKWHMTKDVTGITDASSVDDLEEFGFQGWEPPDSGQDTNPAHFGGGCAPYDRRWAKQTADFLNSPAATSGQPFALIVSFVNPHDALAYPTSWDAMVGNAQNGYCNNYLKDAPGCFNQGISLPPTADENLLLNYKPAAQAESLPLLAAGLGPLATPEDKMRYVNFYAFLQRVVDQHIGTVLDALEVNPGLYNNTWVIRVSDHGEMGLSHGGLRQKLFNAYEETIRVPIVFSHPKYFPRGVQTDALASLIDIMPTLATLANVPNPEQWTFKGRDLTPILTDAIQNPANPTASVQDSVLFMFDDDNPGAANPQKFVKEPCHIRCIRDQRYKYAVYFDPCNNQTPGQHELYDLLNDSLELNNLADPLNVAYFNPALVAQMRAKLDAKMAETGTNFSPSSPYCG